jgi:hypothetical protein
MVWQDCHMRAICVLVLLLTVVAAHSGELLRLSQIASYRGMCDASGGVVVSSNRFLVANDEDNVLRVYDSRVAGPPVQQFDLAAWLEPDKNPPEADIEAAARVGDRVYWISSHGRNQSGKRRPNRCRFFATDISVREDLVSLTPVARPCKTLLQELFQDRGLRQFGLEEAARRTPKEPAALDIEGLAAGPDGTLLIGFRNPVPGGMALLVSLENPNQILDQKRARFGAPIQLDLGGLGIRDITFCGKEYLIIAGAYDGAPEFGFFRWPGPGKAPEKLTTEPTGNLNPEALLVYAQEYPRKFQLLSDDGSRLVDGSTCKELKDPLQRVFRSFWLSQE